MSMENEHDTSSLRTRRKTSSSISCCFINSHRRSDLYVSSPSPTRFSSCWFRNKTQEHHHLPDQFRGKCKNFIHRMGRHRRHVSADFSYDPLSYAMNFEDDETSFDDYEDFPARNFAARLPSSPPRSEGKMPPTSNNGVLRQDMDELTLPKVTRRQEMDELKLPKVTRRQEMKSKSLKVPNDERTRAIEEVRRSLEMPMDEVSNGIIAEVKKGF